MSRHVLLVTLLLWGCDPSEPDLYVPTYDPGSEEPVTSTEFCSLLARNTCAVLRPCCQALPFAWDEAKCRISSRSLCEARRTKSMELGLLYDDVQAGRCVRGTAILFPGCRSPVDEPISADVREACTQVFHGTTPIGGRCENKFLLECAPPRLGARVFCDRGVCTERRLREGGESCGEFAATCAAGLGCLGEPPRCTAWFHPLGAPCTPSGTSELNRCDASRDRFCDSSHSPNVCAELPAEDEPCDAQHGCRRPWRCDVDRGGTTRCTDAKPLGETCNDDKECGSKLCSGMPESPIGRICVPSNIGFPIASLALAKGDPVEYVTRIAAMCSGVIPEGAGSLAPFLLPTAK